MCTRFFSAAWTATDPLCLLLARTPQRRQKLRLRSYEHVCHHPPAVLGYYHAGDYNGSEYESYTGSI